MEHNYRHEYKFLISRSAAELLRTRLARIMESDPHAGSTGRYTIRSLYFDDFDNTAYEEKMSGVDPRTKYRIRYYNYDPSAIKLERKEKRGDLTRKLAQTISLETALALEDPATCPNADPGTLTQDLLDQCRRAGLRPRVLVDYDRTPFICRDGNTRITLDENLRTRPYCSRLLASHEAMIPVLEPDQVILEVKFDDYLPGYLRDAIADVPRANLAISKFALCMNYL